MLSFCEFLFTIAFLWLSVMDGCTCATIPAHGCDPKQSSVQVGVGELAVQLVRALVADSRACAAETTNRGFLFASCDE